MSSDPITDALREGLQAKYPFLPEIALPLLAVVVLSLAILFIWLRRNNKDKEKIK